VSVGIGSRRASGFKRGGPARCLCYEDGITRRRPDELAAGCSFDTDRNRDARSSGVPSTLARMRNILGEREFCGTCTLKGALAPVADPFWPTSEYTRRLVRRLRRGWQRGRRPQYRGHVDVQVAPQPSAPVGFIALAEFAAHRVLAAATHSGHRLASAPPTQAAFDPVTASEPGARP
jgi:hypothetical protein